MHTYTVDDLDDLYAERDRLDLSLDRYGDDEDGTGHARLLQLERLIASLSNH